MDIVYIGNQDTLGSIACTYKGKTMPIPVSGFTDDEIEDLHGIFSAISVTLSELEKQHDESSS